MTEREFRFCPKCNKEMSDKEWNEHGVCYWCVRSMPEDERATYKAKADAERQAALQQRIDTLLAEPVFLTTETVLLDKKVKVRFGIISAERVLGQNIFKDWLTLWSDTFGGQSKTSQNILRDAREAVLSELKQIALSYGANAVIGVDIEIQEIAGGGKTMLMVAANGTAAIVE